MITSAYPHSYGTTVELVGQFSELRADYRNQRDKRWMRNRTGLPSMGAGADYHLASEYEYYDIIEHAREYDRNDSIVQQFINRSTANVIQKGFTLIPETGSDKLDKYLLERWTEWSRSPELCDVAGQWTWHDFEYFAERTSIVDGDCVIMGLDDGRLQFFEGHNIARWGFEKEGDDRTFLGVQLDEYRRPIKYWITADPVGEQYMLTDHLNATGYNVRSEAGVLQMFYVGDKNRSSLTRAISKLYPIFIPLGMVEDINLAKLVQQQVASCYAIFRQRAANAGEGLPSKNQYGNSRIVNTRSGTRQIEGILPGMEIVGEPGEELKGFSPNTPNPEFFEHIRQQLAIIGANLDLTPSQVCLDFTPENFVGYRGAIHEARKGIKRRQRLLANQLHGGVYRFKVAQWMSEDPGPFARRGVSDPVRHIWQPPAFDYLEPVNDAKADVIRLREGLTSRRRLQAERDGADWQVVAHEIALDNGRFIEEMILEAQRLNKLYPEAEVTWRDVGQLPTASGFNASLEQADQGDANRGASGREQAANR